MQVQQNYLMAPRNKMQSWQLQSSENKCFCKLIRALVIEYMSFSSTWALVSLLFTIFFYVELLILFFLGKIILINYVVQENTYFIGWWIYKSKKRAEQQKRLKRITSYHMWNGSELEVWLHFILYNSWFQAPIETLFYL